MFWLEGVKMGSFGSLCSLRMTVCDRHPGEDGVDADGGILDEGAGKALEAEHSIPIK